MRKFIILAALTLATQAYAAEKLSQDAVLGTTIEEVKSKLSSMGYDVRKAEIERGTIEVYFVNGNERGEVYVSPTTGKVVSIRMK